MKTQEATHACTTCKGTKEQEITVNTHEDGKWKKHVSKIKCCTCDGTGQLTQKQIDFIEWEKKQWCKCKGETGTRFYDDGEHPECDKHHYRCTTCGLIKQIG